MTSISDSEKNDGSLSDTAVSNIHINRRAANRGTASSGGNGGMGEKSNSTSQLSESGRSRRVALFGARQKSITVHRSEEVMPDGVTTGISSGGSVCGDSISGSRRLVRQGTSISSDGETDIFPDTCSESWLTSTSHESHLSEFIEGKKNLVQNYIF